MDEFTKKEGTSGTDKRENNVSMHSGWHRNAGDREVPPLCISRGLCVMTRGDTR